MAVVGDVGDAAAAADVGGTETGTATRDKAQAHDQVPTRDKAQKMTDVAEVTLRIVDRLDLSAISFARVARDAKVSRPWLYKYVGKTKDDLIQMAARRFGLYLAGLELRSPRTDNLDAWVEETCSGTQRLFRDVAERPWMLRLYFRFKGTPTVIGKVIAEIEARYTATQTKELCEVFRRGPAEMGWLAQTLVGMRLGLAFKLAVDDFVEKEREDEFLALMERWLRSLVRVSG